MTESPPSGCVIHGETSVNDGDMPKTDTFWMPLAQVRTRHIMIVFVGDTCSRWTKLLFTRACRSG